MMTKLEDDLRAALHAEAHALRVPERPGLDRVIVEVRRRPGSRWVVAAACLALVVAGVVVLAQGRAGDPDPAPPVASAVLGNTLPAPITNGWVAFESTQSGGGDIYLARPGEEARPLAVDGSDAADEACPAWSPDGTRLLFGRVIGSSETAPGSAELVVVPVGADGTAGAPTVIVLDGFEVLEGFDAHPCGIWAPDGRWVAFGGTGEVWVVDTQTAEIRRLPDLRPSDLEWRPGTDELAIAGDLGLTRAAPTLSTPVTVYSVSTDELRPLGAFEAAHLTWSPDGSTLAYSGGEEDPHELWLVDAGGANERLLVADTGEHNHGIGPVWSPTGDRIAYQRLCCARAETHDVVLVGVADGIQTVIAPPEADGPGENVRWYPFAVTWSPDGGTLLYAAWRSGMPPGEEDSRGHVITVPIDTPGEVTVLGPGGLGDAYSHGWALPQTWGRHPG